MTAHCWLQQPVACRQDAPDGFATQDDFGAQNHVIPQRPEGASAAGACALGDRRSSLGGLCLGVVTGLEDNQVLLVDDVHQAVLFVDPPRPASGENVTQWLRLADACPRIASSVVDQAVDLLQSRRVVGLPPDVVLPPARGEDEAHLAWIEAVLFSCPSAGLRQAVQ